MALCEGNYQSDSEAGSAYSSEEEEYKGPLGAISDTAVRHGFIMKVYTILGIQLIITTGIAAVIMMCGRHLIKESPTAVAALMWISMIGTIALVCFMSCNPQLMRTPPQNYVLLFAFTVLEALLVGFICTQYTIGSVLFVTAITGFVVIGLTLFACQTTYDFTGCGPYLYAALLVLIGFSFCMLIARLFGLADTAGFQTLQMILAGFGALLFSFYIVYDTQLIVGGKHKKHQFDVDDYCFAALNLYLDIINLFLFLLQLFGNRN